MDLGINKVEDKEVCSVCGKQLKSEKENYCFHCGNPLRAEAILLTLEKQKEMKMEIIKDLAAKIEEPSALRVLSEKLKKINEEY